MPGIHAFYSYYRVFQRYLGHKILVLGAVSLITTLTEGLGVALFFAYLQSLAASGTPTAMVQKLYRIFEQIGIPTRPTAVVIVMIVAFVVRGFLVLFRNGYQFGLYMRLLRSLTGEMADEIGTMNYLEYLRRDTGHFAHLATKEIENSITAFYQIGALIPSGVSILTYLILSLQFEWRFTLIAIIFGLGLVLLFRTLNHLTKKTSEKMSRIESSQTSMMIQLLHAFKYLKSTGNAPALQKKIKEIADQQADTGRKLGFLGAIIPAASEPLIVLFVSVCVFYQSTIRGLEIAPVLVSLMFLYRVMKEGTVAQSAWQTLMRYGVGVERVTGCLNELRSSREPNGSRSITSISQGITLDGVTFKYGNQEVISRLNLTIPARQMVAFVGESGAGKSTLVDLIAGILSPVHGTIAVDGIGYPDLDRETLHRKIGYVTQETVVFDDSVANNITLWRGDATKESESAIWRALERAQAAKFVREMPDGLQQVLGDRGVRLSGGQKQRIAIARELFRNPDLLILDEATSALDSESESAIQKSIELLKGEVTIIVIAHRLSTVKNCDQIFVLEKGRVVESGKFDRLASEGKIFKRMVEVQNLA